MEPRDLFIFERGQAVCTVALHSDKTAVMNLKLNCFFPLPLLMCIFAHISDQVTSSWKQTSFYLFVTSFYLSVEEGNLRLYNK